MNHAPPLLVLDWRPIDFAHQAPGLDQWSAELTTVRITEPVSGIAVRLLACDAELRGTPHEVDAP